MSFPTDLRYFRASEFAEPDKMDRAFLRKLDSIRASAAVPLFVTSSYRDGPGSAHHLGCAVDVADNLKGNPISSRWRFQVVRAALQHGITRIGIYDRHIHLDTSEIHPQDVLWTGISD